MAQSRARNQDLGLGLAGGSPVGADDVPRRRRARAEIDTPAAPAAELPSAQGRRLSEAERRALQERRRARLPSAAPPPGLVPEPAPPLAPPRFLAAPPRMPSKPVPRMPRTEERATGTPRGLVAGGAVLLVGLTVLALAGGRLFGSAGDEPPRDTVLAAADATGIPVLVLGTPASGPVAPLVTVPPATPAAAAFPGGRAPIDRLPGRQPRRPTHGIGADRHPIATPARQQPSGVPAGAGRAAAGSGSAPGRPPDPGAGPGAPFGPRRRGGTASSSAAPHDPTGLDMSGSRGATKSRHRRAARERLESAQERPEPFAPRAV